MENMNKDVSPQQDVAIMSEDKDITHAAQAENTQKAHKAPQLKGSNSVVASYAMFTLLKQSMNRDA